MRALAICTTRNRIGRHDGDEFRRECQRFAALHGADILYYHREMRGKRRRMCEQFLRSYGALHGRADVVAVFGHGGAHKLYCTGHARRHLDGLADALADCLCTDRRTHVLLYCCLTGRAFGFADDLYHRLRSRGLDTFVIAHTTAGHTTANPAAEYSGIGPDGRGIEIVPRSSTLYDTWRIRLRDDRDFRLTFWRMPPTQLDIELQRMPPLPRAVKNQI